MWHSMSISKKIWMSLSILIIGYFASMMFGYFNGKQTEARLIVVSERHFPASRHSEKAVSAFDEQIKSYNDAVMMGDPGLLDAAQKHYAQLRESLQSIIELPGLSRIRLDEVRTLTRNLAAFSESAHKGYQTMTENPDSADADTITRLAQQTETIQKQLATLSQEFVTDLKSELASINTATRKQSTYNIIAFIVVVTGSIVIIWLILSSAIISPLRRTVQVLEAIAQGDLSVRLPAGRDEIGLMGAALNAVVKSLEIKAGAASQIANGNLQQEITVASDKDTLGKALAEMVGSLNNIVAELNFAAAQVDTGSKQIADSSTALSQGATQQAAALEEISSSMTQIGDQTKTNAENASQANQLATAAHEAVKNGTDQMGEMVAAMTAISDSSNEIGKIIKTIDDIAFQTNLLALNASVEAARAGKHGKGFAVVAQEVRSLAARSAQAAKETADLIESSLKKVEDGNNMAGKTSEALKKINEDVAKVTDLVGEIAAASNEQAQGIAQVNTGLGQVDSVTQRNTANAEETSSAAGVLSSQAAQVHHLLERFKLKETSTATPAGSPISDEAPSPPMLAAGDMTGDAIDGWGAPSQDQTVDPGETIALDDDEFGKY